MCGSVNILLRDSFFSSWLLKSRNRFLSFCLIGFQIQNVIDGFIFSTLASLLYVQLSVQMFVLSVKGSFFTSYSVKEIIIIIAAVTTKTFSSLANFQLILIALNMTKTKQQSIISIGILSSHTVGIPKVFLYSLKF